MQLTANGNIKQCQYMVQWIVTPELRKVNFQLNVRMPSNHWTGVGFSNDGTMTNSDSIIAILGKDGRITLQDRFSPSYDKPLIDSKQNIDEISSQSVDGLWTLNFSRSLYTQDDLQDADLRQCQHFIFLHTANPLTSESDEMKKHIKTPIISENKICLGKCGQKLSSTTADVSIDVTTEVSPTEKQETQSTSLPTTLPTTKETDKTTQTSEIQQTFAITETTEKQTTEKTTTTTTTTLSQQQEKPEDEQMNKNLVEETPEIIKQQQNVVDEKYKKKVFNVAIKLPNEKWDEKLGEPESEEFSLMSQKLSNSLQSLISIRWPSLQMINVQKFAEGSVLALLQMTFNTTLKNNEELPTTKQLKHFLKEAAAQKMPAELVLDSEMLEVQENEEEGGEMNDNNEIGEEKEKVASMGGQWQGWLLAVLGTFMLLSIATALLFCAFRNRKHSRQHQTYPTKHHSSLHRHNQNNLRGNNLFFNGSANNYNQSHYTPFPGEKEDRASENSTTAKTNNSGGESCNNVPNGVKTQNKMVETPRGIGEASYREWFKKVASKDTPTHYQENYWQIPPPTPLPRSASHGGQTPVHAPSASPYLSYPNDPTYYTLNGEHRIVPPPPAYYRPF
uniref:DOMON domain-containing protein n=2 Tax=Meloidogyne TaxID=189290 RepID=A0A915NSR0_9BILA